jgi:hypothetical protein
MAPTSSARSGYHAGKMKPFDLGRALLIVISLGGPVASAHADAWTGRPAVPTALAVPDAAKVVAHFHATGAQIYSCGVAAGTATYAWTLKGPAATLYDQKGGVAGTHSAGPTWTAQDGSSVVGKKVAQADAPSGDAIPWLLLRADKTAGSGILAKVAYVQRVGTKSGKAPTATCDAGSAGTEKRSDYSAEYYFYSGAAAAQ